MSQVKIIAITIIVIVAVAATALLAIASQNSMLLSGDYYVKVDNAHISENDSSGGVVNAKSSEPYIYELEAVNESGDKTTLEFGVSRELRQNAYLRLDIQPVRGVVSWSEVPADELPPKVADALG